MTKAQKIKYIRNAAKLMRPDQFSCLLLLGHYGMSKHILNPGFLERKYTYLFSENNRGEMWLDEQLGPLLLLREFAAYREMRFEIRLNMLLLFAEWLRTETK